MSSVIARLAVAAAVVGCAAPAFGGTLSTVKERGNLVCGVTQGLPGFSTVDEKGSWSGFDVDLCRAISAAIFNDSSKIKFTPLSSRERFAALQSGQIDVLARHTTWTLSRDAGLGIAFVAVNYFDGQGFMVRKSLKVNSALELNAASVCVQTATTSEANAADFFRANNMKYELMAFGTAEETFKAYDTGRCDAVTADLSELYAERLKLTAGRDHVILPDVISKEPLAPAVRLGDDQWFAIVKWVVFAMLDAEELGLSSKTIDDALLSDKPEIKRFVGREGNYGEQLGLSNDWAARIIRLVGNYGETFERNIGSGSKLNIARGLNNLWTKGGIQYAPPIR